MNTYLKAAPAIIPLLVFSLSATNIPITATSNQTMVKLVYTAPDTNACTVTGSDLNGGGAIVDLNATLFPGAGSDLTRTSSNGFDPYTLVDGFTRTVFIGGKGVKQGSDGNWYSRPLQVNSPQQFTIGCDSGYSGTVTIATKNLRIGAAWPGDLLDFNSSAFGNVARPTFWYDNQDYSVNDPETGVLRKPMNKPLDYTTGSNYSTPSSFIYYRDVTGSTWSNIANLIATPAAAVYATISTQNAGAFAAWNMGGAPGTGWDYSGPGSIQDVQLYITGCAGSSSSACGGTATLSLCLSARSGGSGPPAGCDSAIQTITLGSTITTQTWPSGLPGIGAFPSSFFANWYPLTKYWQQPNFINQSNGHLTFGTTASSPTVTGTSNTSQPAFVDDFAGGTGRILLPGSGLTDNGQAGVGVVQSAPSSTTLTLTANAPNTTTGTPQPLTGGVLVWLSSGTAATFSMQYVPAQGISESGSQSFPGWDVCSDVPVTNISTDRWGTPYPAGTAPLKGFLCSPGGGVTLVIPATGEVRRLSMWALGTGAIQDGSGNFFDSTDPLTMYIEGAYGPPVYKATYVPPCTGCYYEFRTNPSYNGVQGVGAKATVTVSGGVPAVTVVSGGSGYEGNGAGYYNASNGLVQIRFDGGGCTGGNPVATVAAGVITAISTAGITCSGTPTAVWINSDYMTYTALSFTDIGTQLASYSGAGSASYWWNTGLFNDPGFEGLIGGWMIYDSCPAANASGDAACLRVRVNPATGLITQAASEFSDDPQRWGHRHTGLQGVGNLVITADNPPPGYTGAGNTNNMWGGPWVMYADKLQRNGTWTQTTITATSCTAGTPPVCTSPVNHHLDTFNGAAPYNHLGPIATISGLTGGWTGANGQFIIVPYSGSSTQFAIYNVNGAALNASGFGTYSGSLSAPVMPALPSCYESSITTGADGTAQVTCTNFFSSDGYHGFNNGDPIVFGRNWSTPYWVKVISTNQIELFQNSNLTGIVAPGSVSFATGQIGEFLEACPLSPPARLLPPALLLDSTGAAAGIHRCITIHVDGDPCSAYASSTEHNFQPCPQAPSDTGRSKWLTLQVGDMISNSTRGTDDQDMVVESKTADGTLGGYDLTVMRFWGDLSSWVNPQIYDASNAGWMPTVAQTYKVNHFGTPAFLDAANTANTWQPIDGGRFGSAHQDYGHGFTKGNITYAPGGVDPINNVTASQFQTWHYTTTYLNSSPFSGAAATSFFTATEHYTAHRVTELAPLSEHSYMTDYPAYNPLVGDGGGQQGPGGPNLGCTTTTTAVSGFSHVYDVTPCATYADPVNDIKRVPMIVVAGRVYLQDISGPASLLTDSMDSTFCYAANLNSNHECVPASVQGHVYVAMQRIDNLGVCYGNTWDWLQPCPMPLDSWAGWAVQHETSVVDKQGNRVRRLTRMDNQPLQSFSFGGVLQEADGKASFPSTLANILKNPPWSGADAIGSGSLNNDFDWIGIRSAGDTGELIQVAFGYAKVGQDPALLYCGSRQEMCVSNYSYSQAVPYKWASESVSGSWTPCAGKCTVTVPGVPGETLFYRIYRKNAAGVITSDPTLQSMLLR